MHKDTSLFIIYYFNYQIGKRAHARCFFFKFMSDVLPLGSLLRKSKLKRIKSIISSFNDKTILKNDLNYL
jgi:hypothetical protein